MIPNKYNYRVKDLTTTDVNKILDFCGAYGVYPDKLGIDGNYKAESLSSLVKRVGPKIWESAQREKARDIKKVLEINDG